MIGCVARAVTCAFEHLVVISAHLWVLYVKRVSLMSPLLSILYIALEALVGLGDDRSCK